MTSSISRLRNSLVDRCPRMGSYGYRNNYFCMTKNTRTATIYGIRIWSIIWIDIVFRIQRYQRSLLCTTTVESIYSRLPPRYVCLWYGKSFVASLEQIVLQTHTTHEKISHHHHAIVDSISQCMISHHASLYTEHK